MVKDRERNMLDTLYDAVIDILLDSGRLFSLKITKRDEFKRLSSLPTPFMKNILEGGIMIG